MVVAIFLPFLTDRFLTPPSTSVQEKKLLDSLISVLNTATVNHNDSSVRIVNKPNILFGFDPNTVTNGQLQELGIQPKVAARIINYRNKGGRFRKRADFSKMYGLSPIKYQELKPYIQLPDSIIAFKKHQTKTFIPKTYYFDINTCDSTDLDKLKGIGSILSARIIKYRNRLGGFTTAGQYQEVYGLDSIVLAELIKCSFVNKDFQPKKILINDATKETLAGHPYLGKRNANLIFNYRLQHGRYRSIEDLSKIKVLKIDNIEALKDYLDFN
jgi:DNA uptake protein ComE-like DNA-binding protein